MKNKTPVVFLVDDQKIINFVHRKVITVSGAICTIFNYEDPKRALSDLKKKVPEFILLDIHMPEINGWQFLERLKKENLKSKVIILSSSTSPFDIEKAKTYKSVIEYAVKPLTLTSFKYLFKKWTRI